MFIFNIGDIITKNYIGEIMNIQKTGYTTPNVTFNGI